MLIIEGSDLVGKTTFAKKMLDFLNSTAKMPHIYAHFSKLPDAFNFFTHYLERASRNIVQDRFHMSEIVYSNVCRYHNGQSPLYPEKYRLVDAYLRYLGAITVVIIAEPTWLKRQVKEKHSRGEMFSEEQIVRVNDAFGYLCHKDQETARTFNWLADYNPDIDFVYCVSESNPHPAENANFCAQVLEAYLNRLDLLDTLIGARGPWMLTGI